jgi:hypothetical protein
MQLWEYLTLHVREGIVVSANEQAIPKEWIWSDIQGQRLHHFLNELGKLGWEVVAVSPITGAGGVLKLTVDLVVILKRPLQ